MSLQNCAALLLVSDEKSALAKLGSGSASRERGGGEGGRVMCGVVV